MYYGRSKLLFEKEFCMQIKISQTQFEEQFVIHNFKPYSDFEMKNNIRCTSLYYIHQYID